MSDGLCCKRAGRDDARTGDERHGGGRKRTPEASPTPHRRGYPPRASSPRQRPSTRPGSGHRRVEASSQLLRDAQANNNKLLSHLSRFFSVRCRPKATLTMRATEDDELPDFNPSIYKVVRELKQDDHGVYNCLASIVQDAAFVRRVVARYPDFPVFANLRCGVWYVGGRGGAGAVAGDAASADGIVDDTRAPASGTCYFKSTDGHCNNWSFSATRLNLHVAEAAAKHGGCVIVDATRSTTKRFPDSFSKTVPTWAEVLNRAVVRARAATAAHRDDDHDGDHDGDARARWTDGPHLPPWVAENERRRIRERVPGFQNQLASVDPDISRLAANLDAPLRCVWVSQETRGLPCVRDARDAPPTRLGLSDVHPAGAPLRLDAPAVARRAAKQRRGVSLRVHTRRRGRRGDLGEGIGRRDVLGPTSRDYRRGSSGCVGAVDRITGGPVHKRNGRGGGGRVAGGPRGTLDTVGEVRGYGPRCRARVGGRVEPRRARVRVAGGASGGGGEGRRGGWRRARGGRCAMARRWSRRGPGCRLGCRDGCRLERGVELGASRRGAGFGGGVARARSSWDAFDAVLYCGDEPPTISPGFESTGGDRNGGHRRRRGVS